jgi:hypothetical protein
LFDKDDVLEALYEALGVGDIAWRKRLSRASDEVFKTLTCRAPGAVLTSFWRHPARGGDSGTPTDWLVALSPELVEVHCDCPVGVAVERFQTRRRHPGHLDAARGRDELAARFGDLAGLGALGVGRLVRVDTAHAYELADVAVSVRLALGA